MKTLARQWGHVPRTSRLSMTQPQYKAWYEGELSGIVEDIVNAPETAMRAILNLDNPINPGSSHVFFIEPKKENDVITHRNLFTVFVPSGLVEQLAMTLARCQPAKKVEFFHTLCVRSETRSAAGWIFEQVVHDFLIRTKSITIRWFDEEQSSQTLELRSLDMHTVNTDLSAPPPFYWRPDSQNYPGIDGAIVTNDHVYVIQATTSRKHGILQEGVDLLWQAMPQSKKVLQWKCLFVGPEETQTVAVSASYARCLMVGDRGTRENEMREGFIPRTDMQIGRFSVFTDVFGPISSVSCSPHCEG